MPRSENDGLLTAWLAGEQLSSDPLIGQVVEELNQLARHHMAHERLGHTLQPTALVNEVFLKLTESGDLRWENRAHFFGTCARIMRRILVDHAREKGALKRGGDRTLISLEALGEERLPGRASELDLLLLDDTLQRLSKLDARQADIVEKRFFAGLNYSEIGSCLGLSERTIKKEWTKARVWLARHLA